MPQYVTPTYTYITCGNLRTFQHYWHDAEQRMYMCETCTSVCQTHEPYYRHWHYQEQSQNQREQHQQQQQQQQQQASSQRQQQQQRPHQQSQHDHVVFKPTAAQQQQLHLINTHKVEQFILCDKNAARNSKAFIVDAGIHAIPQLLRLLYCNTRRMQLSLGFYATIQMEDLLFQSTALDILNHCDISTSVDVLFYLLLRKIKCYVRRYARLTNRNDFKVKRIRVFVTRCLRNAVNAPADERAVLPLQYRVKRANADVAYRAKAKTFVQMHCLHTIMEQRENELVLDTPTLKRYYEQLLRPNTSSNEYEMAELPSLPPCTFNLYEFQMCRSSMELFVVPFHLGNPTNLHHTRSFVIVNDINGQLLDFVEITNVRRFFQHDIGDHLHVCNQCDETFFLRVDYELHKMLQCGRGFEIIKLERNCIEIYEHCIALSCADYDWPLYGILPNCPTEVEGEIQVH